MTAELIQLRSDVADRQMQVEFHNASDDAFVIHELRLEDPRLEGPATRVNERETTIAPGRTTDVRMQLPEMACDGSDAAASHLTVAYSMGEVDGTAKVPVTERFPVIDVLHTRECLAAALDDAAAVSFAEFAPSEAGSPAQLTLRVEPHGEGASARITGIHDTNLLTVQRDAKTGVTAPLDIDIPGDATEPFDVLLPIVPGRCDPHAVQEDKRGTVFVLDVEAGGESGEIQIASSPEMRGRMLTWVSEWCGYG